VVVKTVLVTLESNTLVMDICSPVFIIGIQI